MTRRVKNYSVLEAFFTLQAREIESQVFGEREDICNLFDRTNQLSANLQVESRIQAELDERLINLQYETKANKMLLTYFQDQKSLSEDEREELEAVEERLFRLSVEQRILSLKTRACNERIHNYITLSTTICDDSEIMLIRNALSKVQIKNYSSATECLKKYM